MWSTGRKTSWWFGSSIQQQPTETSRAWLHLWLLLITCEMEHPSLDEISCLLVSWSHRTTLSACHTNGVQDPWSCTSYRSILFAQMHWWCGCHWEDAPQLPKQTCLQLCFQIHRKLQITKAIRFMEVRWRGLGLGRTKSTPSRRQKVLLGWRP